jgi:hypothetical protein
MALELEATLRPSARDDVADWANAVVALLEDEADRDPAD